MSVTIDMFRNDAHVESFETGTRHSAGAPATRRRRA